MFLPAVLVKHEEEHFAKYRAALYILDLFMLVHVKSSSVAQRVGDTTIDLNGSWK